MRAANGSTWPLVPLPGLLTRLLDTMLAHRRCTYEICRLMQHISHTPRWGGISGLYAEDTPPIMLGALGSWTDCPCG